MKLYNVFFAILLCVVFSACNDEVFVERPKPDTPPVEEPGIEPEPERTDSLVFCSLTYNDDLELGTNEVVYEAEVNFENHTGTRGVTILIDNYNSSLVRIFNSTYYVTPWAQENRKLIEVPGIDADGMPGFYGMQIPFAFGRTVIPGQYMAGERVNFDLPPYSCVTAKIYTTRRAVKATGEIKYYMNAFPDSFEYGNVTVIVAVPVDIRVEWSDVTPIER